MDLPIYKSNVKLIAISILLCLIVIYFFYYYMFYSFILFLLLICFSYLITNLKQGVTLILISLPFLYRGIAVVLEREVGILYVSFYILIIISIIYDNVINGNKRKVTFLTIEILFSAFIIYLFISTLFISPELLYGFKKLRYFVYSVFSLFIIVFIIKNNRDIDEYFKALTILGFFILLFNIIAYLNLDSSMGGNSGYRTSILGFNPIWLARYMSYCIIGEVYYFLKLKTKPWKNVIQLVIITIMIISQSYFVFLTGSRGPLLGLIISLYFIVIIKIRFEIVRVLFYSLVIIIFLIILSFFLPSETIMRISNKDYSSLSSNVIRIMLNLKALNIFWQNKLVGIGFGGFNKFQFSYPHNILTEILSESGIIGFLIFTGIIVVIIKKLIRLYGKLDLDKYSVLVALFLSSFINANLSGHLGLNNQFWMSIGLIIAASRIHFSTKINQKNGFKND